MALSKREEALKAKLTPEFMATLVEAAKVCGWNVDAIEVCNFAEWCAKLVGEPPPDTNPYSEEELDCE